MWKKWLGLHPAAETEDAYREIDQSRIPRHVAIIMDGNGRWARKRGLPRTFGHRAGVDSLREVIKASAEIGISALTVYAFSTENWKRPQEEVSVLMELFSHYIDSEFEELNRNQVRILFSGCIENLNEDLYTKFCRARDRTAANTGLMLNMAVNYGSRAEIVRAVRKIAENVSAGRILPEDIDEAVITAELYTAGLPDPDLLIRPSGDLRISNFLLWQSAYTELWFTDVHWPDFRPAHLVEAILAFQSRERRFGGLTNKTGR